MTTDETRSYRACCVAVMQPQEPPSSARATTRYKRVPRRRARWRVAFAGAQFADGGASYTSWKVGQYTDFGGFKCDVHFCGEHTRRSFGLHEDGASTGKQTAKDLIAPIRWVCGRCYCAAGETSPTWTSGEMMRM